VNAGVTAVVVAALVVGSIGATIRAFTRSPVTISAVRARLAASSASRSPRRPPDGVAPQRVPWLEGVGDRVAAGAVGRWVNDSLGHALVLADTTVPDVAGRLVAAVALGSAAVLFAAVGLAAAQIVALTWWWLALALVTVVAFASVPLRDVRTKADRRRRELEQVVNDFVQLVAVALTTNRSVEEAITFAADAGDGFGFDLLRRTIATAEPMGVAVWSALAAWPPNTAWTTCWGCVARWSIKRRPGCR
jgi:hypothetical protein